MSQTSITTYFNTRKRRASEDLRGKSKVLLLEREQPCDSKDMKQNVPGERDAMVSPIVVLRDTEPMAKDSLSVKRAVRSINFDSPKESTEKMPKTPRTPKEQMIRSRRLFPSDGRQQDIQKNLQVEENGREIRKVPFEKKGSLSPKKPMTPKKSSFDDDRKCDTIKEEEEKEEIEPPVPGLVTPKKKMSTMERLATENLSLNDIKNKINKSSRLVELKASIARFKSLDQQLEKIQKQKDLNKPQMKKFEKIELEIPVSPRKTARSPIKSLSTPTKNRNVTEAASPQRKILFEPKDTASSPVKCSPTKKPAYQKHLTVSESERSLILPYDYRFLAEVFRCVETVSAILFNRSELITFNKLKPKVQELLRRNLTQNHLAQIKTIYPDAYAFHQQKHRNFGSDSKIEKYELVLTPNIEASNSSNKPDADNILKSTSRNNMGPKVLLERKRKFYNILLERVKDEHQKFLSSLEPPIIIEKEKIMRWHPEFDVEACKEIEKAELPHPPQAQTATAKDILDKVKTMLHPGSHMEKALQRLVDAKMTSKSTSSPPTQKSTTQITDNPPKVNISIVDTPPVTPSTHQDTYLTKAFKGIPKALLEKVRARQAAKALEEMTRTPSADKEATLYSRLPELAKVLRSIYVTERKGVLPVETVMQRLDNSFRTKLTPNETNEHLKLLCKLLPTWTSIHNVREINYLKLDRNADIKKVVRRLEILANEKLK